MDFPANLVEKLRPPGRPTLWGMAPVHRKLAIEYLVGMARARGYGRYPYGRGFWGHERQKIEGLGDGTYTHRTVDVCYICGEVMQESAFAHGARVHLRDVTIEMLEAYAALVQIRGEAAASDVFFGKGDQEK